MKKNNPHTNKSAKVELRQWLLSQIPNVSILDCFCGEGAMWELAYGSPIENYLGLDTTQYDDDRMTIVCDNRRYLRHVQVDLSQYNLFDLDAPGSAAEQLAIICDRIKSTPVECVGFAITQSILPAKLNRIPSDVLNRAEFSKHYGTSVQGDNFEFIFDQFFDHCFSKMPI